MIDDLYLEKDTLGFYNEISELISKDRKQAPAVISELLCSEYYETDFVFRTVTDTIKVVDDYIQGRYQEIIPKATDLVERASTLGLWSFATRTLNILGASYQILEKLEKALECYKEIIKIEQEQNYKEISSMAYNNLGLMFLNLDEYKKAAGYFDLAVKTEKISGCTGRLHEIKLISFSANQAIVFSILGDLKEAKVLLDEIPEEYCMENGDEGSYFCNISRMYYHLYAEEYEKARYYFENGMKLCGSKRWAWKRAFLMEFIKICDAKCLPYSLYQDALDAAELLSDEDYSIANANILNIIRRYHKEIGNRHKFEEVTSKYIKTLEKTEDQIIRTKLESLESLDNLIEESKVVLEVKTHNRELKRLADEALRNRKSLQEVNDRLRFVHDIGKKMTSSLELSKVIDMIHGNLCSNIPFDSFVIVLAEPEKQRLRTLAYYAEQVLQPEISIRIDNKDSIFVYCYRTGKIIVSDDIFADERFTSQKPIYFGVGTVKSCIYMPLKVEQNIIGVCSIQSKEYAIYQDEHVEFLDMFLPYLSIAINNAVYSEKLERSVKLLQKTQDELRKANNRLEQLSSLDGLTKISNRRDFERKIMKLISIAAKEKKPVSVIMVDIDNFKIYNDTYGHLAGDEALKIVAEIIRKVLDKAGGLSARFGGEEFVGAGSGFSKEEIFDIGQRICNHVYEKKVVSENATYGRLTVSIGIAYASGENPIVKSDLMKAADDALYEAKRTTKNRVVIAEI